MRTLVALGIEIVEAEAEVLISGDVPVELRDKLVVVGVEEISLVRSRIVVVAGDQALADSIEHTRLSAGNAEARRAARSGDEIGSRIFRALDLSVDVIEELVFDERPADRGSALVVRQVGIGDDLRAADGVPLKRVVSRECIGRCLEVVGTALRDGVDVGARETSLAHVERGERNLKLGDGIVGDRLCVGLSAWSRVIEAEGVVEVRSIDRDVVVKPVLPRKTEISVAARIELGQVAGASLDGWRHCHLCLADAQCRSRTSRVENFTPFTNDGHSHQFDRLPSQPEVDPERLAEPEIHVGFRPRLEADRHRSHAIRAANPHVRKAVPATRRYRGTVLRSARYVHRHDVSR